MLVPGVGGADGTDTDNVVSDGEGVCDAGVLAYDPCLALIRERSLHRALGYLQTCISASFGLG